MNEGWQLEGTLEALDRDAERLKAAAKIGPPAPWRARRLTETYRVGGKGGHWLAGGRLGRNGVTWLAWWKRDTTWRAEKNEPSRNSPRLPCTRAV
jgi:hypothetical protein